MNKSTRVSEFPSKIELSRKMKLPWKIGIILKNVIKFYVHRN